MQPSAIDRFLRRRLNYLAGHAPWRTRPFDEILASRRASGTRAPARTEEREGVVVRMPDGGAERRELWLLSPGGVAGHAGIVYDPRTRTAVRETVRDWHLPPERHPLLHAPGFPAAQPLPGISLCAVTLSAEGFWHFLIEALPKIHLAESWRDRVTHLLVNGPATEWKRRWLEHAGYSSDAVVWVEGLSHFRCERLLFTPPLVADAEPTGWGVDAVRRLLRVRNPAGTAHRRLWASRGDATQRQPVWERELLARLAGWERVEFSRLPPAETLRLCGETAVLAGPHGANLANAIFLPAGAALLELAPAGSGKPLFSRLARAASVSYHGLELDFNDPHAVDRAAAALREPAGLPTVLGTN